VDDARKKSRTLQGKLRAVESTTGTPTEFFLEDKTVSDAESD